MTDSRVYMGEQASATSLSLLEKVKVQDQSSWERLVALYTPFVYYRCRKAGLQRADAADVGQEVFVAVARKIVGFHRDRPGDSFRRWLGAITRTKILDAFRRMKHEPRVVGGLGVSPRLDQMIAAESDVEEPEKDKEADRIIYRRAIELIYAEFAPLTWRAFWLVVVEGEHPRDVAADLGMSVNAVYLAKSRISRRLKQEFAGLIREDAL